MSQPVSLQQPRHQPNIAVGRSNADKFMRAASANLTFASRQTAQLSRFLGDLDLGRLFPRPRSDTSLPQASTSGRILAPEPPVCQVTSPKHQNNQNNSNHNRPLTISWAGSGLYFFWQLGAMKYLAEHFDLSKVQMAGASGGSIAAALAACRVPADGAISRAYELSMQHNIWQEPGSFLGNWGCLVEDWLDEMLPDNAHELCRGRVTVVVTTLPDCRQVGISDFKDKRDLIDAIMASSHIPLVLDRRVSKHHRGRPCVDGSFPDFFFGNCELLTCGGGAVVFDYFEDKQLKRQGRMDMLQLTSFPDLQDRMRLGYHYAKRLHEHGAFKAFEQEEGVMIMPLSSLDPEPELSMSLSSSESESDSADQLQQECLGQLLAQQGSPMVMPRVPHSDSPEALGAQQQRSRRLSLHQ